MARVGSSSRGAKLTADDEKRLRGGMNKSGASEGKRTRKQADHASGRRDAAPYQHGQIAPPPPEADFSNKRKSVQGQQTAKKAAPAKARSAPRQDLDKTEIKSAGTKASRTDSNVRRARTSADDKLKPGTPRPSGAKSGTAKVNFGKSAKGLKRDTH